MIASDADREAWQRVKLRLRACVGNDVWDTWMTSLFLENVSPTVARLSVLNRLVLDWIVGHHQADLIACWQAEVPSIVNVSVALRPNKLRLIGADVHRERVAEAEVVAAPPKKVLPPPLVVAKPAIEPFLLLMVACRMAGSVDNAERVLEQKTDQLAPIEPADLPPVRIPDIQRVVCNFYGVSLVDMKSARRTQAIVRPRQIAMYLAKTMTLWSLPGIGRQFGGRDHTTVLHATRKIEAMVAASPELAATVEALRREIETVGERHERIRRALLDQPDRDHPHAEVPHGT